MANNAVYCLSCPQDEPVEEEEEEEEDEDEEDDDDDVPELADDDGSLPITLMCSQSRHCFARTSLSSQIPAGSVPRRSLARSAPEPLFARLLLTS